MSASTVSALRTELTVWQAIASSSSHIHSSKLPNRIIVDHVGRIGVVGLRGSERVDFVDADPGLFASDSPLELAKAGVRLADGDKAVVMDVFDYARARAEQAQIGAVAPAPSPGLA